MYLHRTVVFKTRPFGISCCPLTQWVKNIYFQYKQIFVCKWLTSELNIFWNLILTNQITDNRRLWCRTVPLTTNVCFSVAAMTLLKTLRKKKMKNSKTKNPFVYSLRRQTHRCGYQSVVFPILEEEKKTRIFICFWMIRYCCTITTKRKIRI